MAWVPLIIAEMVAGAIADKKVKKKVLVIIKLEKSTNLEREKKQKANSGSVNGKIKSSLLLYFHTATVSSYPGLLNSMLKTLLNINLARLLESSFTCTITIP